MWNGLRPPIRPGNFPAARSRCGQTAGTGRVERRRRPDRAGTGHTYTRRLRHLCGFEAIQTREGVTSGTREAGRRRRTNVQALWAQSFPNKSESRPHSVLCSLITLQNKVLIFSCWPSPLYSWDAGHSTAYTVGCTLLCMSTASVAMLSATSIALYQSATATNVQTVPDWSP